MGRRAREARHDIEYDDEKATRAERDELIVDFGSLLEFATNDRHAASGLLGGTRAVCASPGAG